MLPNATATITNSGDFTSGSRGSATGSTVTRSAWAPYFLTLRPTLALHAPANSGLAAETASGVEGAEAAPLIVSEIGTLATAARGETTSASGRVFLVAKGDEARADGAAAASEAVRAVDEAVYEEVGLQDLEFDALNQQFVYPCPCGDLFELSLSDLRAAVAASTATRGFAIASCPSCSLRVKVLFDPERLADMEKDLSISLMLVGA